MGRFLPVATVSFWPKSVPRNHQVFPLAVDTLLSSNDQGVTK